MLRNTAQELEKLEGIDMRFLKWLIQYAPKMPEKHYPVRMKSRRIIAKNAQRLCDNLKLICISSPENYWVKALRQLNQFALNADPIYFQWGAANNIKHESDLKSELSMGKRKPESGRPPVSLLMYYVVPGVAAYMQSAFKSFHWELLQEWIRANLFEHFTDDPEKWRFENLAKWWFDNMKPLQNWNAELNDCRRTAIGMSIESYLHWASKKERDKVGFNHTFKRERSPKERKYYDTIMRLAPGLRFDLTDWAPTEQKRRDAVFRCSWCWAEGTRPRL